jgi:hypothetical protein
MRIIRKACLSFLRRKKSQAKARDATRNKIHVSREKERRDESKIPDASDKARKRKGKGIGLTKTKVDMIQDGSAARDNPIEGGT